MASGEPRADAQTGWKHRERAQLIFSCERAYRAECRRLGRRLVQIVACAIPLTLVATLARAEAWFECHAPPSRLCTFYVFAKSTSSELTELVLSSGETDFVDGTSPGNGDTWCGSLEATLDEQSCDRQSVTDLNIFP